MAILDAKSGKMIVNSLMDGKSAKTNTGYPAAPEEISHFGTMLTKGAPKLKATDRTAIVAWLTANAPK
jgi:hypothetical protein